MKPNQKAHKHAQIVGSWPASEDEANAFRQGVLSRLKPADNSSIGSLCTDQFWELFLSVYNQILVTPQLREELSNSTPSEPVQLDEDLEAKFKLWTDSDATRTMARALNNGLREQLSSALSKGEISEYSAWRTANQCNACAVFNCFVALPDFDVAKVSVEAARRKFAFQHGKAWDKWAAKMQHGTSLRSSLIEYWLPLGLWSLSINDALQALRLFSHDAIFNRFSSEDKAVAIRLLPERAEIFELGTLHKLDPRSQRDRNAFSKAFNDLGLYHSPTPLAKLIPPAPLTSTPSSPKQLIEFPHDTPDLTNAPSIAEKNAERKADPTLWQFVAASGEEMPVKW